MNKVFTPLIVAFLVLFFAPHGDAFADEIVTVTVNTSSLPTTPTVPGSEIYFDLTDGSGTGDANNTVTISNISLGGGAPGAIDTSSFGISGGESGNLASG